VITAKPETDGQVFASDAFQRAADFYRQGKLNEAAALYRRTLSAAPGHFGALCGIGMIQGQLGHVDEAVAALREAARVADDSADAHVNIGKILATLDRFEEAAERFRRALAIDPDHAVAHNQLANALCKLGDADAAIIHFHQALASDPDNAEAHNSVGLLLQRLGKSEQALPLHTRALLLNPDLPEAHAGLGHAHRVQGRPEQAIEHYQQALEIRPDYAEVHNDLAGVLHQLGRDEDAIVHCQRAIATKVDYVEAHYNLGNVLRGLGRHDEAIPLYAMALRIRPAFAEAHNNLANALQKSGRCQEATAHYEAALTLRPGYVDAHRNLGNAWLALDRHEDAIVEFEKVLAIDPSSATAHSDIAAAHLVMGDLEAAYDAYEHAVELAPRNASVQLNLASLRSFTTDDPRLPRLKALAEDVASLDENEQIALHFALGKALADIKQNEPSFHHLLAGNRLKRSRIAYDETATLTNFDRIRDVFTPRLMQKKRGSGDPSSTPVFIVGMPRSGTSLLEQILASHSGVYGAGEIDHFVQSVNRMAEVSGAVRQFPAKLPKITPDDLRRLGRHYIERIEPLSPDAHRIIDKMPANFAHVGLIHLTLPNARIIHARRDPIDTCLSCFSLLFADEQPHTYDLAELGRYYRAYDRLMRHWRQVLPEGVMLEVRYEDVVDDIEGQGRRLLAHCGLEWEEQCLAFHRTQRPVRTASVNQVRQPIYRDSVGRWLPYRKLLAPLLEALEIADEAIAT
jgi:tetratricopeptide (TPR) repeat protein